MGIIMNWRLRRAVNKGNAAAVQQLLRAGANPETKNPQGFTAIMLAAELGFSDVMQVLIEAGADVNRTSKIGGLGGPFNGVTPLMAACCDSKGKVAPVRLLIEKGAAVGAVDDRGRTAQDLAEQSGYSQISSYLESIKPPARSIAVSLDRR